MARSASKSSCLPTLTVTAAPTLAQWRTWWEGIQHDDLAVAYADSFPDTLTDFQLDVAQGTKHLLLCLAEDQVAGALWLHDMTHRPDGSIAAGWVGGYFVPAYRGRCAVYLWRCARQTWEAQGIRHLFAATHVANRPSQAFIARGMQFHRVGRYPAFTLFHGQVTDVVLYCAWAEDAALAWRAAHQRALPPLLASHASAGPEKPDRARLWGAAPQNLSTGPQDGILSGWSLP